MTQITDSGKKDVSSTLPVSQAGKEIAMLLALQKREWQELRSTNGVALNFINLSEPTSGRKVLLIAIGSTHDDIIGNNTTMDIFINGMGIDAIVERVAQNKMAEKSNTK